MKKISLFSVTFFALLMTSCSQDNAVAPATHVHGISENINEIIVGTWQLREIGTNVGASSSTSYNSNGSSNSGCGFGSSNTNVSWSSANDNSRYSFNEKGEYVQSLDEKVQCKGSYQIGTSDLVITATCLVTTSRFGIHDFAKKELILGDGLKLYRYEKLDKN